MISFRKISILSFLLFILGCSDPAPEHLSNGYYFARTNGYNTYIIKNKAPVVDTYIAEYEVIAGYIIGIREKSRNPDGPKHLLSEKYGYFVLNTKTGELKQSVSKQEYLAVKNAQNKVK